MLTTFMQGENEDLMCISDLKWHCAMIMPDYQLSTAEFTAALINLTEPRKCSEGHGKENDKLDAVMMPSD